MKKAFLSILLCFVLIGSQSNAQTLEETMVKLAGDAASAYVNPIVTGFGANLNGGWFHKAPAASIFGFDLEFGLVGMGTFPGDEAKSIPAGTSGNFRFTGGLLGSNSQAENIAKNATNN